MPAAISSSSEFTEQDRLSVLDSFNILDTPAEPGFDDIVILAREICHTPIALVSLVASDRQWFKAASGLDACETPLSQSVCAHALEQNTTLIIPDLSTDPRTRENELVKGEPFIRFYAGALLRTTTGIPLGTLCVIDTVPRPQGLTERQIFALEALARQVIVQLELRRAMTVGQTAFADQRVRSSALEARAIESELLNARLQANEARLRLAQQAGNVGTFEVDVSSNMIFVSEQFCKIYGIPFKPAFDFSDLEGLTYPEDRHLVSTRELRSSGNIVPEVSYRVSKRDTGDIVWIARHAQIMRGAAGNVQRIVGTVQDITARMAAEERQRLLNDELGHRMKNTMAMVQAIASQTLRSIPDRSAVRAFSERINALSRAHEVLLQQNWTAANMRDILAGVLAFQGDVGRYTLTGPEINCGPKAALSLSLLTHELATNAVKYGALSVPEGHVSIEWSTNGNAFVLSWTERGGPPAKQPTQTGLGTRLINLGLAGTGNVVKRYGTLGFSADLRAPLELFTKS